MNCLQFINNQGKNMSYLRVRTWVSKQRPFYVCSPVCMPDKYEARRRKCSTSV